MHGLLNKGIKFIVDSNYRFLILSNKGCFHSMDDERYLRKKYKAIMGRVLNLNNPKTFNEKLQWLKIHDRKSIYTTMVDKYAVKKYVASAIGDEYIIPTLGLWEHFDDINFDALPDKFVLKCTHDSGGLVIVKNKLKFDRKAAKNKIEKSLKYNYYYIGREWPYKDVPPRIIVEQFMEDNGNELVDYKMMCFNGEYKCSFVCSERYSESGLKVTIFDRKWNVMPFGRHYPKASKPISRPRNYELMIEFAEKLSKDIPFLRVDFYEISGKLYFGELTFYPGSGFEKFIPEKWDNILGSWMNVLQV